MPAAVEGIALPIRHLGTRRNHRDGSCVRGDDRFYASQTVEGVDLCDLYIASR
jgi:hypothetical protein